MAGRRRAAVKTLFHAPAANRVGEPAPSRRPPTWASSTGTATQPCPVGEGGWLPCERREGGEADDRGGEEGQGDLKTAARVPIFHHHAAGLGVGRRWLG